MRASVLRTGLVDDAHGDASELGAELAAEGERPERALPASVAEVYEAHARYVYRCLRGLGVREAHMEDAVQDVFVIVHAKLAAFDGGAKLGTWLYAIVINVARRYRLRQGREARTTPELADPRSAEETFLSRERLRLAHAALSGMADEKREVFVLAEIEQMSAAEIAEATATPLNTVYSRLRAARAEFERRIDLLAAGAPPRGSRRGP
jgi:RNA polymerase sigma-70 factor (ECF subfamily)